MDRLSKFFSPLQLESIREADSRICIWTGAVRSGKTYASIWRFIDECRHGPQGHFAVITKTYDTFKRNLLGELETVLGSHVAYASGKRELYIGDRTIHVIGAEDDRAESKIKGATFSCIYIDEASTIPESVVKMSLSRTSKEGSKIFMTTNPDSTSHWLYRDFLSGNKDVKYWHFLMKDNPSLSKEYVDYITRQYRGVWYRRYVLGEWCQAEGAVYDGFDEKLHCIDFPPSQSPECYILGVDYGTSNPCAFLLIGVYASSHPRFVIEKEYYYDSKVHQRQKTDSEYATDLISFTTGLVAPVRGIYVDPSAASFRLELTYQGVQDIVEADNSLLSGIRFVSGLIGHGALRVTRSCKHLLSELDSYAWEEKARDKGQDVPMKKHDHACDALRYALYTHLDGSFGTDVSMTIDDLNKLKTRWGAL